MFLFFHVPYFVVRYIVAVVFDDDLETMARLAEEEGVGGTGKHLWIFTDSAQSFHAVHGDKARKTLDGNDYNSILFTYYMYWYFYFTSEANACSFCGPFVVVFFEWW